MKRSLLILILFPFLFISACHETENPGSESPAPELKTRAGEVLSSMPEILRPSAHYLIYLHGAIVDLSSYPKRGNVRRDRMFLHVIWFCS